MVEANKNMPQIPFEKRSNMLKNLLVCLNLKKEIKVISGLAFDAVDDDMSEA